MCNSETLRYNSYINGCLHSHLRQRPISSKDRGFQPISSQTHHSLKKFKQFSCHLHEISCPVGTAGFPVVLAGFKWKLSVSAKWWPDTRADFPISGIPHPMAWFDFSVCVCAHSTCVLPHLKAAVVSVQAACPSRWAKRESASSLPG